MTQAASEARTEPREPLHPQVKVLFDTIAALRPAERVFDPVVMRAATAAFLPFLTQDAPPVAVEKEIQIPGPAAAIRALLFVPENPSRKPLPLLVFLHGGGFVQLSPESHVRLTKQLAVGAGVIVVSVDYRLAPEYPYPAGLDDCLAAFRWARENAASLGGDPSRVALAGDSAGGNLTAATVLRLLATGEAPPTAALAICAWFDLAMDTDSFRAYGPDDLIIDNPGMEFYRTSYTPRPEQWDDPFVSPMRADLSGFPPTCVVVGTIDPLCDDGLAFTKRLRQAGREVLLQRHEGMPHDFVLFPGIDEAGRSVEAMCGFLRQQLATSDGR